jgi:hypothetical protein
MIRVLRWAPWLIGVPALLSCYHATVETGAPPSSEVISKSFASGWIYGLVPPSTVSTTSKCAHGPARIETQLSFVNQLVSFLTLGIYTPMEIRVACAASSVRAEAPHPASGQELQADRTSVAPAAPEPPPPLIPLGAKWIASISQKLYYPVGCSAIEELPESDRLYFTTEPSRESGFKRSIVC